MTWLHITVEGATEETFVNEVLAPHLAEKFQIFVDYRSVLSSRSKNERGGMTTYQRARDDVFRWVNERNGNQHHFTTMFDLYALPTDFPGYQEARECDDPYQKVSTLERRLQEDFQAGWLADAGPLNFIPYIQLHEFEALLFAEPEQFEWVFIEHHDRIARLVGIASSFATPEHINNDPNTAPSKRIIQVLPEYKGQKVSAGPLIASKIGLDRLRSQCVHFGEWLDRLESLR